MSEVQEVQPTVAAVPPVQPIEDAKPTPPPTPPLPPAAAQPVTIKANAVEPPKQAKDETVSDLPYHTKETEKIAQDRADEAKANADKPYEYKANGYTVTERNPAIDKGELATESGKLYEIKAGDFVKTFGNKRDAEIYVETHAESHKDMPATISKA